MNTKPLRSAYLYQRFSSEQQSGNSSLFRQTQAQEDWLTRHPEVVVAERLVDHAMSGYKGHHLTKGALGRLVAQIETGHIEKGSLILVEHFSRLSRLNHDETEILLRKIWDGGVTIITVRDNYEYPPSSINCIEKKLRLLFEIDKAYSDSKWRSDKAKACHAKKRIEANKGITPKIRKTFWLDKEGKCNEYSIAIKDMFDLYLSGKGQSLILRELQQKYPNFKPIQKMQQTTVIRCIINENCAGLWHGKKLFEPVVSDKIFYEAQRIHKERLFKNVQPDRKWPLSGLIQCGHCGKGMSIQQSGKSLPLLRCSNKQRQGAQKSGCDATATFPYAVADHFFQFYVLDHMLNRLTIKNSNEKSNDELNIISAELNNEKNKLAISRKRYDKYANEGEDLDLILDLMQTSSKKIKTLEQHQHEINAKIQCSSSVFDISKDIFNLAGKPIELNLALHKLGFKIILKNGTLSYQDKFQLKYMGYDRKNKYYPYKINGEGGFLPSEGLEIAHLLNKTKVLDENTVKVFDGFRDNYVRAIVKMKKGEAITASDIFSTCND